MRRYDPGLRRSYVRRLRREEWWWRGNPLRLGRRGRETAWRRDEYDPFVWGEHLRMYLSAARYLMINHEPHPTGYYFEFGCHRARTMRLAYDTFHHVFDWTYVGFDSFEGFPEVAPDDTQGGLWVTGGMQTSEPDFRRICRRHGMPADRLVTVPGYYDSSLTEELRAGFDGKQACVTLIDCDLYSSTATVLAWLRPLLGVGSVLIFDDWTLYFGDRDQGERRAFTEFRERHPEMGFEPLFSAGEQRAFVVTRV